MNKKIRELFQRQYEVRKLDTYLQKYVKEHPVEMERIRMMVFWSFIAYLSYLSILNWFILKDFSLFYLYFAFSVSLFYGLFAVRIFTPGAQQKFHWRIYQAIFNFFGAAIGFLVLYYLIKKGEYIIVSQVGRNNTFTFVDLLLLVVALMGICGHLPYITFSLSSNIGELMKKLITKYLKV